jgi:hypothetical protein
VVGAAARGHRRLLQGPHPRGRLARVEDASVRSLDLTGETGGQGRHPREVAEEVERGPLGGEQGAGRARDPGHLGGDRVPPLALGRQGLELARADLAEGLRRNPEPEQDSGLLLGDGRDRGRVVGNHRLGGDVARPNVLRQGAGDQLTRLVVDAHRPAASHETRV